MKNGQFTISLVYHNMGKVSLINNLPMLNSVTLLNVSYEINFSNNV